MDTTFTNIIVKEFKPRTGHWSDWLIENGYVLKRKYWYSPDGQTRYCNLSPQEHHAKWYSQHDENGDYYWCPDCSDMQVG
jgi:hypothetical protein